MYNYPNVAALVVSLALYADTGVTAPGIPAHQQCLICSRHAWPIDSGVRVSFGDTQSLESPLYRKLVFRADGTELEHTEYIASTSGMHVTPTPQYYWSEPTFAVDVAPHDRQISGTLSLWEQATDQWSCRWQQRIVLPIERPRDANVRPFEDAKLAEELTRAIAVVVYSQDVVQLAGRPESFELRTAIIRRQLGKDGVLAIKLTLNRLDSTIGTARIWIDGSAPEVVRVRFEDFGPASGSPLPHGAWRITVEADPSLALNDFDAVRFWSGRVHIDRVHVVPLRQPTIDATR